MKDKALIRGGVRHPSRRGEAPIGTVCRDVKYKVSKTIMPRNKDTNVNVRLPQDIVDYLYAAYPGISLSRALRDYVIRQFRS